MNKEESQKINVEMKRLYIDEGHSLSQIAKAYGMSKAGVSQRLERFGVPLRPRNKPLTKEELEELYIEKGMTIAAVAKKTGRSDSTVRKYLEEHGIPVRDRTTVVYAPKFEMTREDLERMYLVDGMSQKAIADHYGCAQTLVSRRLDQFKIAKEKTP